MDHQGYREGDVMLLEQRIARLELVCEAMWTLLRDETRLSDASLQARIAELDLSDGKADGRAAKGPLHCPKCRKPASRRHEFCIWCGAILRQSPFD